MMTPLAWPRWTSEEDGRSVADGRKSDTKKAPKKGHRLDSARLHSDAMCVCVCVFF